jgi:hypothetical protein
MWFVRTKAGKHKNASGSRMLLTRREAIAGYGEGLAVLTGPSALAAASYPNRPDSCAFGA